MLPTYLYADVVQLTKRNAPDFAIDGGEGAVNRQDVFLSDADDSDTNQLWNEIDRGNGFYSYQKLGTNHCIDGGAGGERRQNVYLWQCIANNANQQWKKIDVIGGFVRLEKRNSSEFSIDGQSGGRNGQSLYLWSNGNSNQNQHWHLNYLLEDTPPSTEEAATLLIQSTFGSTKSTIDELQTLGYSEWFRSQQTIPIEYFLDKTNPTYADTSSFRWELVPRTLWFQHAINAEDQLRQRAAFALSQIFVVSTESRDISFKSHLHSRYMDIMQEGVFGNFRDLLENVTYSPFMGLWLTYLGNEKANEETGSAPDENYAREVMQLFTIGLVELQTNGQPNLFNGEIVETYTTQDVSELAKVFTGLWWDQSGEFGSAYGRPAVAERDVLPMIMFDEYHSPDSKSFLGHTIPEGTNGNESIRQALDVLFNHQNVAPFIGKHLIQRMTTSNPTEEYVTRVSTAFNNGFFTLPDGTSIGSGERGDMTPVWAAILFDPEARDANRYNDRSWGKVREPLIRFIHWARVAGGVNPQVINDTNFSRDGTTNTLGQNPYRANSVFNFYRPGFSAPNTATGNNGLVAPELQITTSTTAVNYPNLMQEYILRRTGNNWRGNYTDQTDIAESSEVLTDYLNLVMTGGRMTERTWQRINDTIASVSLESASTLREFNSLLLDRVHLGMLLTVNSPEYNTQQ